MNECLNLRYIALAVMMILAPFLDQLGGFWVFFVN